MFLRPAIVAGFTLASEITHTSCVLLGSQEYLQLLFSAKSFSWSISTEQIIFVAVLVLSMSVVSQGCVMQVAKASTSEVHGAVTCESPDADLRAKALANLQFSWKLAVISLFTGFIFVKLARIRPCSSRNQSTEYEQLRNRGTEVPITIVGFK
ncbi:hypothetical protein Tsubulata_030346 [Turnera subulata]|uniref:Uncharacterized protein n=1 Tax=Turnera subulata TaxID=218843 RepID=A0A9Q0JKH7_9ROSI|nr:hypothetical protein Tsubulata_030346 [Turnera subulata]